MTPAIHVDTDALGRFCRENNIQELAFFGSVLSDEFGPESDVDVLVGFENGAKPGFFDFIRIERELEDVLGVDDVDLHTPESLNRRFRHEVLSTAEVQYASA